MWCSRSLRDYTFLVLRNVYRSPFSRGGPRAGRPGPCALPLHFAVFPRGGLGPIWHGDWVCPLCPWPNNTNVATATIVLPEAEAEHDPKLDVGLGLVEQILRAGCGHGFDVADVADVSVEWVGDPLLLLLGG